MLTSMPMTCFNSTSQAALLSEGSIDDDSIGTSANYVSAGASVVMACSGALAFPELLDGTDTRCCYQACFNIGMLNNKDETVKRYDAARKSRDATKSSSFLPVVPIRVRPGKQSASLVLKSSDEIKPKRKAKLIVDNHIFLVQTVCCAIVQYAMLVYCGAFSRYS